MSFDLTCCWLCFLLWIIENSSLSLMPFVVRWWVSSFLYSILLVNCSHKHRYRCVSEKVFCLTFLLSKFSSFFSISSKRRRLEVALKFKHLTIPSFAQRFFTTIWTRTGRNFHFSFKYSQTISFLFLFLLLLFRLSVHGEMLAIASLAQIKFYSFKYVFVIVELNWVLLRMTMKVVEKNINTQNADFTLNLN